MTCHNNLCDRVIDLSIKSFTPSHVRDDSLIHPGCAVREVNSHLTRSYEKIHQAVGMQIDIRENYLYTVSDR